MGNTSGKSAQGDDVITSFQHLSNHDGKLTEREAASTWYRYGVSVTDVYDIVEFLGHGHMGETFTVRRKTTGHHTAHTRERSKGSESDLLRLAKEREEREEKKAHKKSISDASSSSGSKKLMSPKKLISKAKAVRKVSGGSSKAGKETNEDDNHDLSHFIKSEEEIASEVIHEPPKHSTQPVKSIMKDSYERKFSYASELTSSTHHTREDSTGTSVDTFGRLDSTDSVTSSSGGGGSGKSKKGVHFQRTFAVKTILTSRVNTGQLQELVNEILIMRKLDHPYIVKLYEVYHVKRKLWLVTELLTGGDLSTRKLNEHQTKNVIEQVLRALVYLHRMGIVHRDIKLENILYENHSKNATVRLIDFGLSRTFDRRSNAADYVRTPYTISPESAKELLSSKNAKASDEIMTDKKDVWAVGVVTFLLLSGEFPFIKSNSDLKDPEKMNKLKMADVHFGITWKGRGITPKAKEFIRGCLQADPDKRWTAKQALENLHTEWAPEVDKIWNDWQSELKKHKHPEFVKDTPVDDDDDNDDDDVDDVDQCAAASSSDLGDEEDDDAEVPAYKPDSDIRATKIKKHVQKIVKSKRTETSEEEDTENNFVDMDEIERYTKFGFMKKTILLTMANTMDRSELVKLREIFLKADTNDTGTITLDELLAAFRKVSPDVDVARVENLFIGMDRDKSGHIHYAEFLAALAESHGLVTLDRLTEAFDRLDTDGKGYIDRDDLKKVLGKEYDEATVDKMIEEGDFKKNNKIDYEELLQLMFSDPVQGDKIAGA